MALGFNLNNKDFTKTQEFMLSEIAPNFVFGCTWNIATKNHFERNKAMYASAKRDMVTKVKYTIINDVVLIEADPEKTCEVMATLEGKIPFVDVKRDIETHKAQKANAANDFLKFLERMISKKETRAVVGMYCINESPKVTYTKGSEVVAHPAFRLTIAEAEMLARSRKLSVRIKAQKASPSATAILCELTLG